ncbi:retropepsin-like aspartic protease family protein [Roseibium sp.]|uniref:retropepsin-like aspartic protease family protein n=1 Tax=Roseibium sp. TaxID=1936156 RepID=UPI003A98829E
MWRYLLIAVVLAGTLPLLPRFLERNGFLAASEMSGVAGQAESSEDDGAGSFIQRIPRQENGHYVAEASLNGRRFLMLVDTGASQVVLPEAVARQAGINLQSFAFKIPVTTANGVVHGAATVVRDMKIGRIRLRDVDTLVLKDDALKTPLLGMSALNQLQRFDFSNDTLLLVQ